MLCCLCSTLLPIILLYRADRTDRTDCTDCTDCTDFQEADFYEAHFLETSSRAGYALCNALQILEDKSHGINST